MMLKVETMEPMTVLMMMLKVETMEPMTVLMMMLLTM